MGPLFSFFKSLKTVSQSGLPYLARFFNPVIRSRFSCNCNNSTLSLSLGLGATQNPSFAQEEIFQENCLDLIQDYFDWNMEEWDDSDEDLEFGIDWEEIDNFFGTYGQ